MNIVWRRKLTSQCRLWVFKITIVEFFRRLTDPTWEQRSRAFLNYLYFFLLATFVAVIVSDLAECRPFSHHWQVLPDPGPHCRQAYGYLLTLAATNVFTDLLLVIFPIPIILHSGMPLKKKVQLILLFSLSLAMVATTLYRVPHTIWKHGSQQYRSLMASVEILFAATAANALALGSFVRDRGVKKPKFRHGSEDLESVDRRDSELRPAPALHRQWGSDEDLVRGLGLGVKPELRAPPSEASYASKRATMAGGIDMEHWEFPRERSRGGTRDGRSDEMLLPSSRTSDGQQQRQLNFFDVGGLLDNDNAAGPSRVNGGTADSPPPAAVVHTRRGSAALLQDLGGFLSFSGNSPRPPKRSHSVSAVQLRDNRKAEQGGRPATPELRDVGGLAL